MVNSATKLIAFVTISLNYYQRMKLRFYFDLKYDGNTTCKQNTVRHQSTKINLYLIESDSVNSKILY